MAERVTVDANDPGAVGAGLLAAVGSIFVAVCGGGLGFAIHDGRSPPTELIVGLCVGVVAALVGLVLATTLWKDTTYTVEDDALVERRWRHERRIPWSAIRDLYLTLEDTAVVVPSESPPLRLPVGARGRDALLREVLARSSDAPFRRHGERGWTRRDEWPITFTCVPWRRAEAPVWFGFAVVLPVGMIACGLSDGSHACPDASLVARAFGPLFWLTTPMIVWSLWAGFVGYRARRRHRRDELVAEADGLRFTGGGRVITSTWRDLVRVKMGRATAFASSLTITTPDSEFTLLTDGSLALFDLLRRHAPDAVSRGIDEDEARDDLGPPPDEHRSVHHYRQRQGRFFVAMLVPPTALLAVAFLAIGDLRTALVSAAFPALLLALAALALSVRVTLDDRGITRQRLGFTTVFAWSEITCVRRDAHESLIVDAGHVQITVDPLLSRFSHLRRTILRRAPKDALA